MEVVVCVAVDEAIDGLDEPSVSIECRPAGCAAYLGASETRESMLILGRVAGTPFANDRVELFDRCLRRNRDVSPSLDF